MPLAAACKTKCLQPPPPLTQVSDMCSIWKVEKLIQHLNKLTGKADTQAVGGIGDIAQQLFPCKDLKLISPISILEWSDMGLLSG